MEIRPVKINKKTLLCMPSRSINYVSPWAFLGDMRVYSATKGVIFERHFPQSTPPEVNRNLAIEEMYKRGCDEILYIDADQTFPADLYFRLANHKKPIVGVNCSRRIKPIKPVMTKDILGRDLEKIRKKHPLVKMEKIGFAATLIQKEVFDAMPNFVFHRIILSRTEWIGEDYIFCQEARKAGFAVYCDLELSQHIGHIGEETHYLGN